MKEMRHEMLKDPKLRKKIRRSYLPWYKAVYYYARVTVVQWWNRLATLARHAQQLQLEGKAREEQTARIVHAKLSQRKTRKLRGPKD